MEITERLPLKPIHWLSQLSYSEFVEQCLNKKKTHTKEECKIKYSILQQFCQTAAAVIQNPFLLQEIAFDSAHYLSRSNPSQFTIILCSPMLNILVQRCLNL